VRDPDGVWVGEGLHGDRDRSALKSQTRMHTISVDPRRSMRAATRELEVALDRFGANLDPSSRSAATLLATELVAQVVGRELNPRTRPVNLVVKLRPDSVRLETRGSALRLVGAPAPATRADGLAEWGRYLLDRLADDWGMDDDEPPNLWAEVGRS
jgi:hypothetical protein